MFDKTVYSNDVRAIVRPIRELELRVRHPAWGRAVDVVWQPGNCESTSSMLRTLLHEGYFDV